MLSQIAHRKASYNLYENSLFIFNKLFTQTHPIKNVFFENTWLIGKYDSECQVLDFRVVFILALSEIEDIYGYLFNVIQNVIKYLHPIYILMLLLTYVIPSRCSLVLK
jgi:hypothetical protein